VHTITGQRAEFTETHKASYEVGNLVMILDGSGKGKVGVRREERGRKEVVYHHHAETYF
jgi:hypothetical protein